MRIGVLSLQGAFREHINVLHACGCEAVEVRTTSELEAVDALIIPGGESTAMFKIAETSDLFDRIRDFIQKKKRCVWGTCAGLILLSDRVSGQKLGGQGLIGGLDVETHRNFFGRQLESFEYSFVVPELGAESECRSVFIRAPAILTAGAGVTVLGRLRVAVCEEAARSLGLEAGSVQEVIVAARQGTILATAFHPELTGDTRWHRYFMKMVAETTLSA